MYLIYLITNLVNGKVYVGQTVRTLNIRWYMHKYDADRDEQFPICRAIRKYGIDAFTIRQIDKAESREQADFLEMSWIFLMDSRNKGIGYNVREGGNSSPMAQTTKDALRASRLGRPRSAETKALLSEAGKMAWVLGKHQGHPHTEEYKRKQKGSRTGHKSAKWKPLNNELLVFLYNNHVSQEDMSKHFGVNTKTIDKHLKATNFPLRYGHRHKEIDEELLTKLFHEGESIGKISTQLGCQWMTVSKRIEFLGLTRSAVA